MPNMSYCRFQNTANDLSDCYDNLTDELSGDEANARIRLVKLARQIVEAADYGDIPGIPANTNEDAD